MKFKTNIKCEGCVATVTPHLNEAVGEGKWRVDLADPAKVLSVEEQESEDKVKLALQKAGYKAERL